MQDDKKMFGEQEDAGKHFTKPLPYMCQFEREQLQEEN